MSPDIRPIPSWAKEKRYEYDLGMSTFCNHCGDTLKEGQIVFEDQTDKNTFYCSFECVWITEEGATS